MFSDLTKLHVWELHILLMLYRQMAFRMSKEGHFFSDYYSKALKPNIFYIIANQTEISGNFYSIYSEANLVPLVFTVFPESVGKTSLNIVVEMRNKSTMELYASNFIQCVTVDQTTRKSVALPDWFREKYQSLRKTSLFILPAMPESSQVPYYECSKKVEFCDIDHYNHTNFTSYIKYGMEVAAEASRKKIFSGLFSEPFQNYEIKTVTFTYHGESRAGDVLTVIALQNQYNRSQIHFDIKFEQKRICQGIIEFFRNATTSSL